MNQAAQPARGFGGAGTQTPLPFPVEPKFTMNSRMRVRACRRRFRLRAKEALYYERTN
jgi:hypothetical protein